MLRRAIQQVSSKKVWRSFLGPGTVEVCEAIKLLGPCTVSEVMSVLGWRRAEVLKHLEGMVKSGLVKKLPGGSGSKTKYDVVAENVIPTFELGRTEAERRLVARTIASMMSSTARCARATAAAGAFELDAKLRNFTCYFEFGYLTPEQFAKVRSMVRQITEIMAQGKAQRKGRLYLATMLSFPVVPRRPSPRTGASQRRTGGTPRLKTSPGPDR